MRVFIPTKGRATTISTHRVFDGLDYTVIVHTESERADYAAAGVPIERIRVSGVKADAYGLTRQREWVMQNLVSPGEWFVFADDNIRCLTAVIPDWYGLERFPETMPGAQARKIFYAPCPLDWFVQIANDTVAYANRVGAQLCGFAVMDSWLFRTRKFRSVGYVVGKLMLMQQNSIPFDHTITMEDFRNTAEHLYQNGAAVINNYLWPRAGHYEAGGMGKYEERIPYRKQDVQKLLAQYPGLFRVHDRVGFEPGTDLSLRLTQPKQIARWRAEMRKLREQ